MYIYISLSPSTMRVASRVYPATAPPADDTIITNICKVISEGKDARGPYIQASRKRPEIPRIHFASETHCMFVGDGEHSNIPYRNNAFLIKVCAAIYKASVSGH